MAVREFLNRHPWVVGATAGALILIAIIAIVWRGASKSETVQPGAAGLAHYAMDDGATWFTDSAKNHLERYTPEARRAIMAIANLPPEQQALEDPASSAGGLDGIEVKRPKDKVWVRASDPRGQAIMQPLSRAGRARDWSTWRRAETRTALNLPP